jgi:hypothetical protein
MPSGRGWACCSVNSGPSKGELERWGGLMGRQVSGRGGVGDRLEGEGKGKGWVRGLTGMLQASWFKRPTVLMIDVVDDAQPREHQPECSV